MTEEAPVPLNRSRGGRGSLQRITNHFPCMAHRMNLGGNGCYYPDMAAAHLHYLRYFPTITFHIFTFYSPNLVLGGKQVLFSLYKKFGILLGGNYVLTGQLS